MNVLAPAVLLDAPVVFGRGLDAMDVLVVNALGGLRGAARLNASEFSGDASAALSVSMTAVWARRHPEQAEEALLGDLAPHLVEDLVADCGEAWRAEAEAVVDLALASRLDELALLPVAMCAGGVAVDGRGVTALLAPAVWHPQAVWLV